MKRKALTRWWSLPAAALVAATLAAGPASAATLTVNTAGDAGTGGCDATECTLREAVAAANDETTNPGADTITFDPALAGQTIELTQVGDGTYGPSALNVQSEVEIVGPSGDDGVTIARAASASDMRLFRVATGGDLTLENLTLSDGVARGGNGGSGGNGAGGAAGLGGAVVNEGELTIDASTLSGNQAVGGNGGPGNGNGCSGAGGGLGGGGGDCGLGNGGGPNGGSSNFNGDGGDGGFGGGGGGGTFGDGGDGGFGGGGGGAQSDPPPVRHRGNGGFGGGGGSGENGPGSGGFGGGDSGPNARAGGGGGGGLGGAVFNDGGTVAVTNSTLSANTAQGGNGGNGFSDGENGRGLGGGLFNRNGTVTVLGSTFASNTAGGGGGGVYNLGDGATSTATLNNTIVADTPSGGTDFEASTTNGGTSTTSGTNNLIETGSGFGGSAIGADPKLGPLTNNGGPTVTHALLADSPAIDAGASSALTTDQRGETRPYNDPFTLNATGGDGTDIGAFEVQTDSTPPTLSINDLMVKEGNSGTKNAPFSVNLSEPVDVPVTVEYAISSGTAKAGSDYTAVTNGSVTIPAGQATADLNVAIRGDRMYEKNETFVVTLSQPTNATISDGQGTGTIKNDDRKRRR